ncbi:MAG: glycoside-pentoside-hexuronide (GPH):cation symporter [Clostridia bacterium]|nr:glycoside-pentoside-hexuronide (GPH):cation symporter [Clostridia bacterium]
MQTTLKAVEIHSGKLSFGTKLGFGICDLGGNLFFTMMGFYLLFFMTDVVGLAAGLAGTALMIGKIWDAITDPTVGYISDRTRTRWGRRRPYMFIGSFLLFGMMIVMFKAPGYSTQGQLFAWGAIMYCLLCTAYTLVNIPYGALTPELTTDYNERTVLNAYRMSSAVIGTLIGAGLVLPIVGMAVSIKAGWTLSGTVMGAIMMITGLVTVFSVREPVHTEAPPKQNIFKSYAQVLGMKTFLTCLIPWTLHITGITIIQGALLYYFIYVYGNETGFQLALVALLISAMIFIPIWTMVSKRIGKKKSYNIGMLILSAAVLLFFLIGHRIPMEMSYIIMAVAGFGFATQYVMPYAIIPDVVEYDYAENGIRREGVFYGLWTFTSKVGQAFAIALSGWTLSAFGYIPEAAQTDLSLLGIRLLCGPVPIIFFITGVIVLSFYPITREKYAEILQKIALRNGK